MFLKKNISRKENPAKIARTDIFLVIYHNFQEGVGITNG
jgi:hypothetical protein